MKKATHPVTIMLVFIYQMENWCYNELNRACRYKDHSKVSSLAVSYTHLTLPTILLV